MPLNDHVFSFQVLHSLLPLSKSVFNKHFTSCHVYTTGFILTGKKAGVLINKGSGKSTYRLALHGLFLVS